MGQWAMGIENRALRIGNERFFPCPMPHAPCPIPNAQFLIKVILLRLVWRCVVDPNLIFLVKFGKTPAVVSE